MAKFPAGTRGAQLDVLARMPIWNHRMNFLHGTGHGVGHFLSVHEGPQSIRMNENPVILQPGMVTSNEPGVYKAGSHGIRTENLTLVCKDGEGMFGEYLKFETITLCPICKKGIIKEMLTNEEIEWLNNYHQTVYEKLSPDLIMEELGIPQPEAEAVTDIESGVRAAARIGYPVLVRPSYVLGGRAMQIVSNEERLRHYLQTAVEIDVDQPVLVDRYIMGKELEVDAICDGKEVFIPGIMEHVEHTGIHSGDSISVYPTFSVSQKAKDKIIDYTVKLGLRIGIVGLYNIQFIVAGEDDVYVIEVNPRSSRTVP